MAPDLDAIISKTLEAHAAQAPGFDANARLGAFQWPWNIAKAGAEHLKNHGGAVNGLVSGGSKVVASPAGSSIVSGISQGPTNPANTDRVLDDGIFSGALDSVKADDLLRTVFIGFAGGAQIGFVGGGGGSGVAYDIVDHANRAAVSYGAFDLGIGGKVTAGLIVGAMTAPPHSLNASTNVWSLGASIIGIGVFIQVIMRDSDLGLIGFGLNLGGGAGASSATGYGKISAS